MEHAHLLLLLRGPLPLHVHHRHADGLHRVPCIVPLEGRPHVHVLVANRQQHLRERILVSQRVDTAIVPHIYCLGSGELPHIQFPVKKCWTFYNRVADMLGGVR